MTKRTKKSKADDDRRPRGFAAIDPALQRKIASKGGKAAHAQGRAHEFTSEEAKTAGSKGGKVVAAIPGHMAAIGRAGGRARMGRRRGDDARPR